MPSLLPVQSTSEVWVPVYRAPCGAVLGVPSKLSGCAGISHPFQTPSPRQMSQWGSPDLAVGAWRAGRAEGGKGGGKGGGKV